VAALRLTDALIGMPAPLSDETRTELDAQFSAAEQAELAMGVGLFLGMSKVLITLGVEPENMPTTVMPTPGSNAR
jgi:alkylhydroperoxidase family enzyme